MKRLLAITLVACGACGAASQRAMAYEPTQLASGHFRAAWLRTSGTPDTDLSSSESWTLDIDRDNLQVIVTGPTGAQTRHLTRLPDAQHTVGCYSAGTMSREETFVADGPLTVAGTHVSHPVVVARCPDAHRVTVSDGDARTSAEIWFDRG